MSEILMASRSHRRVRATAQALHELGVCPGDRVMITGDNSAELAHSMLGLAQLNTSLVAVDGRQPPADLAVMAEQAGVRWIVHDGRPPLAGSPGETIDLRRLAEISDALPLVAEEPVDLSDWYDRPDAIVLWSSGSTGRPKGIVRSGASLRHNTLATIEGMGFTDADVFAPLIPFSHQYGLSLLLIWWQTGGTLTIHPPHRPDLAVALFAEQGVTSVEATPGTYHSIIRVLQRRPELRPGLACVRTWGVGGAPLPASLSAEFLAELGKPLLDGYGMSEAGNIAIATPDNPVDCGRPLPGVRIRVLDGDGAPVAAGELGEVEVATPALMAGYLADDGVLTPIVDRTWFRTGDLGRLDAAGNLRVVGRKRAVHRAGYTLYPEILERKAEACGRPVVVLGSADERLGSTLHFVVADGGDGTPREWRERMAPFLADYEQPNSVQVVAAFPLTGRGKVDLPALRAEVGLRT